MLCHAIDCPFMYFMSIIKLINWRKVICCNFALYFLHREELDKVQQKWYEDSLKYEEAHLGNFRRIYPAEGTEKYDKFFQSSGSLYQETAAFKARSECARYVQDRKLISTSHCTVANFYIWKRPRLKDFNAWDTKCIKSLWVLYMWFWQ